LSAIATRASLLPDFSLTVSSSTTGSNQLQTWDDKISSLTQRILGVYEPPEFNTLRQLSDQASPDAAIQSGADPALRVAVAAVCDALVLNLRLVGKINEAKEFRAKPKLFQNHSDPEIAAILTQPVIAVDPAELQNPGLFNLTARKYKLAEIYDLLDAQLGHATAILTDATRKLRDTQQLLFAAEDEAKRARQNLSQVSLSFRSRPRPTTLRLPVFPHRRRRGPEPAPLDAPPEAAGLLLAANLVSGSCRCQNFRRSIPPRW
jgi:hypothetical protein